MTTREIAIELLAEIIINVASEEISKILTYAINSAEMLKDNKAYESNHERARALRGIIRGYSSKIIDSGLSPEVIDKIAEISVQVMKTEMTINNS